MILTTGPPKAPKQTIKYYITVIDQNQNKKQTEQAADKRLRAAEHSPDMNHEKPVYLVPA